MHLIGELKVMVIILQSAIGWRGILFMAIFSSRMQNSFFDVGFRVIGLKLAINSFIQR